jgi:bacterioferritin
MDCPHDKVILQPEIINREEVMDKEKIIEMLNEDLEGEHAAIIQYLTHAYAMGEGEMACEIEAIAREEMRHLDFLAETIVELGGIPSLKRGEMRMGGKAVAEWMGNDVLQEEDAVNLYKEHINAIDDPKIKRLLKRILSDEESHHGDFQHFVDKAKKEGAKDIRGTRRDEVAQVLDWGIEHEYTVILQYLLHSYLTPNEEVKEEMQDQAINEMQHLGWLAEEMVGGGGSPRIEHTEVDRSTKTADMLRADIKIEKEVAAEYDRAAKEIKDTDLKKLLLRIRDHEVYHTEVFTDLLKEEEK